MIARTPEGYNIPGLLGSQLNHRFPQVTTRTARVHECCAIVNHRFQERPTNGEKVMGNQPKEGYYGRSCTPRCFAMRRAVLLREENGTEALSGD